MQHNPPQPFILFQASTLPQRVALLIVGLILFGVGIAVMVRADLGLGPWEVFHQGIARRTGLEIGTVSILMGIPILLGWIPLRQKPGWGTLLNIILIGLTTDATLRVLVTPQGLVWQVLWLAAGILTIGVGCGLYLSAKLGAGPRDGLMMGLHQRTGWSVKNIRTLIEVTVLLLGAAMGGTIGIGTVAFAFGIGPIVQPVMQWFGGLKE